MSKNDTANVQFLNARKFYIYKVNKGETVFSISQKFNIPQEEILQFNHEIEKNGLKTKMKLWIPAYSWLKKDSVIEKEIAEETSGKSIYEVAVVTNLELHKIYTDSDTSETFIDEPLKKDIKENLEFVEGIIHSAEVLKSEGLKVHFFIIDSENDSIRLLPKLKKNHAYNLIITNESGAILKCISNFSDERDIKLLSCGLNTTDIIRRNKNAFALIPSSGRQCELMGIFAGKYFTNSSLILIKTVATKENERSEFFLTGWKKNQGTPDIQVDYSKGGSTAVADCLEKTKTNVIFISSSNEDFVSSLLTSLNSRIPECNVRVIGLPTWQYFETIDQNLIDNCNVYLFSSGFIEYNTEAVLSFRKFFREKYNTEPSEVTYQGFDAFLVAGKSLLINNKKFFNEGKTSAIKGIFSDYTFTREENGVAWENQNLHVFQPGNDISIDLMKNFKMK